MPVHKRELVAVDGATIRPSGGPGWRSGAWLA